MGAEMLSLPRVWRRNRLSVLLGSLILLGVGAYFYSSTQGPPADDVRAMFAAMQWCWYTPFF